MNSTGCSSRAKAPDRTLTRQLILSRDNSPFACEIRLTSEGSRSLLEPSQLPAAALTSCAPCRDILQQPRRERSISQASGSPLVKKYLNRTLIRLSEPSLSSFALTHELIQAGRNLRDIGHSLVVSLSTQPLWEPGSKYKKNIVSNMYSLKDHGIEIALDGVNIQNEAMTGKNTLNLFNYIKLSVSSLDQCLKLNGDPEFLNRLHDRMVTLSHNHKISFIADRVEHIESHSMARALPFDYFQGSHYSPADRF